MTAVPRTTAPAPHRHLEVLAEHECHNLLAATHFGRVALSVGALPHAFPVHYALLDGDPVFRSEAGTKVAAASAGNVICLEVDAEDPETHTGWSVMVIGRAEVITDDATLARAQALPLQPWAGRGDAYVRISSTLVSGRRVVHGHREPPA